MKKLILASVLALVSMITLANPAPKKSAKALYYKAVQNLYAMYGKVDNVEWRPSINNMARADFAIDGTGYAIFFNAEGDFVAETKKVDRKELPMALRKTACEKFKDVTMLEMLELTSDADHSWFFKTESAGVTSIWRGDESGRIEAFHQK